jgi:cell wall-associated NlpC family hydrolase
VLTVFAGSRQSENLQPSGFSGGRRAAVLAVLICAGLASGCSNAVRWESPATPATPVATAASAAGGRVAQIATSMIGTPYRWGGAQPDGFDCSGLVQFSYQRAGRQVPRTSAAQYAASRQVALREARVGDLVFFSFERKVSHVGIYLGDGRFVHAPSTGKRVEVASLRQPPYSNHFVAAGRLL